MVSTKIVKKAAMGICAAGLVSGLAGGAWLATTQKSIEDFQINYHDVDVLQWDNDKEPLRMAFMADPHIGGDFISVDDLDNVVEKINEKTPDIIMIGGDLVLESMKLGKITGYDEEEIAESLGNLEAKYGVYYVNGDHDWEHEKLVGRIDGSSEILDAMRAEGIKTLENDSDVITREDGSQFAVAGTSYFKKPGPGSDFDKAAENIPNDMPTIFMTHDPRNFDLIPETTDTNIVYMLAGETHCGQVWGLGRLWLSHMGKIPLRYHGKDFTTNDGVEGYVTCGVGNSFMNYRNIKPQAEIITLR